LTEHGNTRLQNLNKVAEKVKSFALLIAYLAEYTNSELTLVTPEEFVTFANLALTSLGGDFEPSYGLTPQDAGMLSPWVPRIAEKVIDKHFGDSVELLWQDLQDKMSSSPVNFRDNSLKTGEVLSEKKTGGIDFRILPITMQPLGSFKNLTFSLPEAAMLSQIDINREIGEISQMVDTGIVPNGERIKELVAACYHKNELAAHQKNCCLV